MSVPGGQSAATALATARPFDITGAKERLAAGNGGYEVVHRSEGLELGVYVLVAPEPDQRRGAGVMRLHPVAELPRQDATAGHRQRPLVSGLGDRTGKNVLLEGGAIEPPGSHP